MVTRNPHAPGFISTLVISYLPTSGPPNCLGGCKNLQIFGEYIRKAHKDKGFLIKDVTEDAVIDLEKRGMHSFAE
jgi:hypothetical protein